MSEKHEFLLRPVIENGAIILLDIYVNGEWVGSRRTFKACEKFLGLDKPR